jgi:hypothetical protein
MGEVSGSVPNATFDNIGYLAAFYRLRKADNQRELLPACKVC